MFCIHRIVAIIAQVVPVVSDCATSPGENQFFKESNCLVPFCSIHGADRGFIRIPRHLGICFAPYGKKLLIHRVAEPLERTVFMIRMNLKKTVCQFQTIALKCSTFRTGMIVHGRKAPRHNANFRRDLFGNSAGILKQGNIFLEGHTIESR